MFAWVMFLIPLCLTSSGKVTLLQLSHTAITVALFLNHAGTQGSSETIYLHVHHNHFLSGISPLVQRPFYLRSGHRCSGTSPPSGLLRVGGYRIPSLGSTDIPAFTIEPQCLLPPSLENIIYIFYICFWLELRMGGGSEHGGGEEGIFIVFLPKSFASIISLFHSLKKDPNK